jgi:hypothetical protein
MDFSTFDRLLLVLRQQAMVSGAIFVCVAILFAMLGIAGGYILRAFFRSKNKKEDTWFAYVGTVLIFVGIIGVLVFLQIGLPRLLNPSYYALGQYLDFYKTLNGVYKP